MTKHDGCKKVAFVDGENLVIKMVPEIDLHEPVDGEQQLPSGIYTVAVDGMVDGVETEYFVLDVIQTVYIDYQVVDYLFVEWVQ